MALSNEIVVDLMATAIRLCQEDGMFSLKLPSAENFLATIQEAEYKSLHGTKR